MKIVPEFFRIFLCSAAILAPEIAIFAAQEKQISVDKLFGLKLSGYGNDDKIQWALETVSASLVEESGAAGDSFKHGKWRVEELVLKMFSSGKEVLKMKSPAAIFLPETRHAESDFEIEVLGEEFSVSGQGWSWNNGDAGNEISVRNNVKVELVPEKKSGGKNAEKNELTEKLFVSANSLQISETNEATILKFFGNVAVKQGEIAVKCDELEILVPAKIEKNRLNESSAGTKDLSAAVRKISGSGNVRIEQGSRTISGTKMEFHPAKDMFYVFGDAKFFDEENDVEVSGENALGEVSARIVEILGDENGEQKFVSVALPSSEIQKNSSAQKMRINGERLVVSSENDGEITIFLDRNVRLTDGEFSMNCNRLTLVADSQNRAQSEAESASRGNDRFSSVKKIEALGNVSAIFESKKLSCEAAEFFPREKRILLTGAPKIFAPEEGFSLSGDRCEILGNDEQIFVYSSKPGTPKEEFQNVKISLPALNSISQNRSKSGAGTTNFFSERSLTTKIVGEDLIVSKKTEATIFDLLGNVKISGDDLDGSCDRIVVFAAPSSKNSQSENAGKIQQTSAIGNVELRKNSVKMTGWKATIEHDVVVSEWIQSDDTGEDGENPSRIVVEADPENVASTRPRFFVPETIFGSFSLSIDEKAAKKNAAKEENFSKVMIEGDRLEVLSGTARTRFWLRGNVRIFSDDARAFCNTAEGLLSPAGTTKKFSPQKIICRGDIEISHDETSAFGDLLEIFPPKNIAVLRGNSRLSRRDGTEILPGNDRFVFDMKTRKLQTGKKAVFDENADQVSRPKITIPAGRNSLFVVPNRN